MNLDPDIWGPHYWFFLHTLAYSYPATPNAITKRKYYDCIHNLPLFIPHDEIGNKFSRLLDKYPVTPYLDKRESFLRWVNFIHNKVNYNQGKEEVCDYTNNRTRRNPTIFIGIPFSRKTRSTATPPFSRFFVCFSIFTIPATPNRFRPILYYPHTIYLYSPLCGLKSSFSRSRRF